MQTKLPAVDATTCNQSDAEIVPGRMKINNGPWHAAACAFKTIPDLAADFVGDGRLTFRNDTFKYTGRTLELTESMNKI